MNWWMAITVLTILAMVLIAVDFYLPGFVLGSIGAVLMLVSVGIAWNAQGMGVGLLTLFAETVLGVGVGYVAIKYVPQTAAAKKMFLTDTQTGQRAGATVAPELIGHTGTTLSVLRPSGVADVDGKRLDVVAESGMIASGETIKIVAVQENRIVVRKV